ncbi:MAG TPA: hypothetical protein PK239_10130 [Chitinophagales bacterium]|nr:hypothetical protein [Chitinophagales bacterium]HRK27635.1 hypothetical protein [Chitinophagales bacterium]
MKTLKKSESTPLQKLALNVLTVKQLGVIKGGDGRKPPPPPPTIDEGK